MEWTSAVSSPARRGRRPGDRRVAPEIVAAAWFFLRNTAEQVDVDDVITTFCKGEETALVAASPVPERVYVYVTEGYEKTDALTWRT